MSDTTRAAVRAVRNTSLGAAAALIGKVATLVLFGAIGRAEGQEGLGAFLLAFAICEIAMMPVDFGLDRYLVRRVSVDRGQAVELFADVLALRLLMGGPVVAAVAAGVALSGYPAEIVATTALLAVGVLLDLVTNTPWSLFTAIERAEWPSAVTVAKRVLTAVAAIAALIAGAGIVVVAACYAAFSLAGGLVLLIAARRVLSLEHTRVAPRRWRALLGAGAPFMTQDVLTVLLYKLDVIILSALAGQAAVGLYGAAYRLLEATLFVAYALVAAFAPMYAYLSPTTTPSLREVYERSVKAGVILLAPVALVAFAYAEPIMAAVFGDALAGAGGALMILAPVMVLLTATILGSTLLVTRRSPVEMVKLTALAVVLNVALNALLIPSAGAEGAAWAMLISYGVFAVIVGARSARLVSSSALATVILAPGAAAASMVPVLALLAGSPVLGAAAGFSLYAAVFLIVERRVNPRDFDFLAGLAADRLGRTRADRAAGA